jgi:FKBP-type peptidyl-prolyl cis-trans isomerase SlyD
MLVELAYEVYDAEGELVGASSPTAPWLFVFGYGQASMTIERAIEGLTEGAARRVRLDASEAFGQRDESAVLELERGELPEGVRVGDELEAESEATGASIFLRVLELTEESALVDANHPLAGRSVEVDLVVDGIRPAFAAELAEAEAALASAQGVPAPGLDIGTLIPAGRLLKRSQSDAPPGASGLD